MTAKVSKVVQKIPTDEKIIANMPCALVTVSIQLATAYSAEKVKAHPAQLKEKAEDIKNLYRERCNNWPMMSFIQSGSETIKLDGMYVLSQHNSLTSFDVLTQKFFYSVF